MPDVSVVRPDCKRPPAKRDAEFVLRRYVPAVALQLAHHVARNDLQDDVDKIAVNCWSRFFDPASGKLKDAFVASLTVKKQDIHVVGLMLIYREVIRIMSIAVTQHEKPASKAGSSYPTSDDNASADFRTLS